RLVSGEPAAGPSDAGPASDALCRAAGSDSTNTTDILVTLWDKFVLPAANSSVATLTRLPFGKLRDDPEVFGLFEKSVGEVAAVGRARGIRLAADVEARMMQTFRGFPAEMMPR